MIGLPLPRLRPSAALGALTLLMGCAAAGVPETSDPYVKLDQAAEKDRQGRIAIEERLLEDAVRMFRADGDELGLAEAYRQYALLLRQYPNPSGELLLIGTTVVPAPDDELGRLRSGD